MRPRIDAALGNGTTDIRRALGETIGLIGLVGRRSPS